MEQPDLIEEARARRDAGIAAAVEHADAVTPKWSELAYSFLEDYAKGHATFTSEDVREASKDCVPEPPNLRAWGGVFQRASRNRITARYGYDTARDPKVHCNVVTVWRSAIYRNAA